MATTRDTSHGTNDTPEIEPTLEIGQTMMDWGEPDPEPRDWKKVFLVAGLGALSWVATYVGMLELIQANMGELPLTTKAIIGFSVAMLMTMIIWLLDQLFSPVAPATKFVYGFGYVFLTMISVGFGFGFYWKVLESRSEATRSAETAIATVQTSLHAASTRLQQLNKTLINLTDVSTKKAEIERATGKSCPNSRPGDGPRRKMRDADAQQFRFASEFVSTRLGSVTGSMTELDSDLKKIVSRDESTVDKKSGTRNDYLRSLNRKLDLTVTGFNAFRTDPQLRQIRTNLADRSDKTIFPNGRGGTYACPDIQLQTALRGVVRAIDQLPQLEKPQIAAVEGSEATIEAFRRLTATIYGAMTLNLPPSSDELRTLQKKAVQSVQPGAQRAIITAAEQPAGLARRDYVPLAIAIFVDLCLFLVSMGRPMNRFMATKRKMMEAEMGPVFPILHRFNAIHNDKGLRATFAIFREVIFDSGGIYHVAVPLNAPHHAENREDLLKEAQTLANLCFALEGQGVLVKPWRFMPALTAERKLRQQGSKFVECYQAATFLDRFDHRSERPAFRIYAFKNGAWPEMILGAVMGAARRMEAEEAVTRTQRRRAEIEADAIARANQEAVDSLKLALNAGPLPVPEQENIAAEQIAVPQMQAASAGVQPSIGRADGPVASATPRVADEIQSEVKTAYGKYAARAQREIKDAQFRDSIPSMKDTDVDEMTRDRRRQTRAVRNGYDFDEQSTAQNSESENWADQQTTGVHGGEVVTFPNTPRTPTGAVNSDVEPVFSTQSLDEDIVMETRPHPTNPDRTDVTLVRETATFSVPTTSADLPVGLLQGSDAKPTTSQSSEAIPSDPNPSVEQATNLQVLTNNKPADSISASAVTPPPLLPNATLDDSIDADWSIDTATEIGDVEEIEIDKISQRFSPPAAE